jgi:hypothetical protein
MYLKISHLTYVLDMFSNFTSLKKTILFLELDRIRINEFVNWNNTYDLAIKLQFLKEYDDEVKITLNGNIFLSMKNKTHKLSDEQKLFVFKNGILDNDFFKSLNDFFKLFTLNKNDILELYKTENTFQKFQLLLQDKLILFELNILIKNDDRYMINESFSEIIIHRELFGKKSMSQNELDKILEEQKKVGNLGEKLTLQYEQNEFRKKKWNYQEKNVRIISKKNVRAGYDVESFLTQDSKLDFSGNADKHIEVKSRKYNEFSFFISANELKIGKILSQKSNQEYFIYFWNNLGQKPLPTSPTKIIPFQKLNIKLCKGCLNYLVELT